MTSISSTSARPTLASDIFHLEELSSFKPDEHPLPAPNSICPDDQNTKTQAAPLLISEHSVLTEAKRRALETILQLCEWNNPEYEELTLRQLIMSKLCKAIEDHSLSSLSNIDENQLNSLWQMLTLIHYFAENAQKESSLTSQDIYPNKLKNWFCLRQHLELQDHLHRPGYTQGCFDDLESRALTLPNSNSSTCLGIQSCLQSLNTVFFDAKEKKSFSLLHVFMKETISLSMSLASLHGNPTPPYSTPKHAQTIIHNYSQIELGLYNVWKAVCCEINNTCLHLLTFFHPHPSETKEFVSLRKKIHTVIGDDLLGHLKNISTCCEISQKKYAKFLSNNFTFDDENCVQLSKNHSSQLCGIKNTLHSYISAVLEKLSALDELQIPEQRGKNTSFSSHNTIDSFQAQRIMSLEEFHQTCTRIQKKLFFLQKYLKNIFQAAENDFKRFHFSSTGQSELTPWDEVESLIQKKIETSKTEKKHKKKHNEPKVSKFVPVALQKEEEEEEEETKEPVKNLLKPAFSPFNILEMFTHNRLSEKPPISIPRGITEWTALHLALMTGRTEKLKEQHINQSVEENLSQTISPYVRSIFNHMYLGSCSFELISKLIHLNRPDLLSAIVPMWVADRYLTIELYGSAVAHIQQKNLLDHHSLIQVKETTSDLQTLPKDLSNYLTDLSEGILWYRYPVTQHDFLLQHHIPITDEFRWIQFFDQLSAGTQIIKPSTMNAFIDFANEKLLCSFKILYNSFFSENKEALIPLITPLHDHLKHHGQFLKDTLEKATRTSAYSQKETQSKNFIQEKQTLSSLITRSALCQQKAPTTAIKTIVEEIMTQLIRIKNTLEIIDICQDRHLFSFLLRNLLNSQWLFENIYNLELMILGNSPIHSHKFHEYETLLDRHPAGRLTPPLDALNPYNCNIWLHYEALCDKNIPPLNDYLHLLKNNIREATCDSEFTPAGISPKDGLEYMQKHAHCICGLLDQALQPLLNKLEKGI